jgi:hypothetical protein
MTTRPRVLGSVFVLAATLGLSVLSGTALSGTAQAATPASSAANSIVLASLPTHSSEYRNGFRDGYRVGFGDGRWDAEADCVYRGGQLASPPNGFAPSEYDSGYADGFGAGYGKGFKSVDCDD